MAKISLRNYDHLIENLIENGQHDEAIAHCRHILQTFPKYIEVYRLLGKTYLEAKHYNEAVDIFQRVLMSVPDDFVSHVGLSIIADDQSKLDEAIWHMERAFETQPSNAAIQGELQRLFGRRDGVEPPKIRLTRGALAHMYVQGELYAQAVSEIRAVLAADLQRMDMQVLLAKAYFRMGQKADATDSCSQLLKRYPYCFEANRILVEILPGTQRAESTQVYRQRVIELEPYSAFVQDSIFHPEQVADAAVNLEQLEYKGQVVDVGANWGSGLGIGLPSDAADVAPSTSQPDWLKRAEAPAASSDKEPAPVSESQEQIPDFLRQAGWGESTGEFKEDQPSTTDESESAPAIQADLPDWIKAMAPVEAETPLTPPTPPTPAASAPVTPAMDIPDWLQNLDKSQPTAPAPQPPVAQQPVVNQPAATGAESLGELGKSAQEQDDAMAWLESLAAKHGAKAEELVTDPKARTDVAPDWVDKAKAIGEPPPAAPAPAPEQPPVAADDQTGMWLRHLEASEAETIVTKKDEQEPSAAEESSDWMSRLSDQKPSSQSSNEPAETAGGTPDWLKDMQSASAQPAPQDVPDWLHGMEQPAEPAEPSAPSQDSSSVPPVDLPAWLAGLDKEESTPLSAASEEELPAWLANEVEPQATERTQPEEWHPVESESQAVESTQPADWSVSVEPPSPVKVPSREINFEVERPQPVKRSTPKAPRSPKPVRKPEVGGSSLESAQAEMGHGNIGAAIEVYAKLIRKGKSLEEIIRDLREALYRYPVEVPLWQALGDAYMRANRLQEALDAYTKAEELLR
jgi:tetratricopeptide (TPR) repeat protein